MLIPPLNPVKISVNYACILIVLATLESKENPGGISAFFPFIKRNKIQTNNPKTIANVALSSPSSLTFPPAK